MLTIAHPADMTGARRSGFCRLPPRSCKALGHYITPGVGHQFPQSADVDACLPGLGLYE